MPGGPLTWKAAAETLAATSWLNLNHTRCGPVSYQNDEAMTTGAPVLSLSRTTSVVVFGEPASYVIVVPTPNPIVSSPSTSTSSIGSRVTSMYVAFAGMTTFVDVVVPLPNRMFVPLKSRLAPRVVAVPDVPRMIVSANGSATVRATRKLVSSSPCSYICGWNVPTVISEPTST